VFSDRRQDVQGEPSGVGVIAGDELHSGIHHGGMNATLRDSRSSLAMTSRALCFRQAGWTVDLPGVYFLQVVEQVYKENRLATGRFVALGQCVDLTKVSCPIYLLAAHDDDLVAPAQVFATARLVGTASQEIQQAIAPCPHLGLFMGRATLTQIWPEIARWLTQPSTIVKGAA
jgi:poly(3-hydroxyalkanoate) synthetase